MAATYDELKTEIQNWLNRPQDAGLTAAIPTMIADAEAMLNRRLRTWEMECSSTTPLIPNGLVEANRGIYALPADWGGQKTVRRDGTDLRAIYYRRIPTLSASVQTNWLLTKHPDLYRYASLVSAESWLKNDTRIPLWHASKEQAIRETEALSEREESSGGPIRSMTTNDRMWELMKRDDGAYEWLNVDDFLNLAATDYSRDQLGIAAFGYFTVSHGAIHIWPKPQGDPTGDSGWSACP